MNAMRTVALRNLAAHKVRLALTLISVVLGTAFVAGSFVFTDTLNRSFTTIFDTSSKGIDAQVQPRNDTDPGVPIGWTSRLSTVPGVDVVEPTVSGPVVVVGPNGHKLQTNGAPSEGAAWETQSVNPVPPIVSGHAPQAAGQVVINTGAADRYALHTGDRVKIVVPNEQVLSATVVGIYRPPYDTGGYLGALFPRSQALSVFTDGAHYSSVNVSADPGVSETTLADRIARILPSDLQVQTGDEVRKSETDSVTAALSFVNYLLLGFGLVALLVGTFIIYNTFAMIVAQRQRELALLRAVGASRRQLRRSVVFEAAVVGAIGSALGVAAGVGLAYGLRALLDALNLGLPSGGLVLSPRTVVTTLVVGTVVTLVAASTPARRAARIAPVAAMQEELVSPAAASLRRRTTAGVTIGLLGTALTIGGAFADSAGTDAALTGIGLVSVCAAALLLSPVLARWVIVPLGRVVGRPFGTVGRLARTNAVRNPRRTAATGFALTLGMVLVAGIAVLGSSVKVSLAGIVDDTVTADYIVTTQDDFDVPQPAADAVAHVAGVRSATQLHGFTVALDGRRGDGTAVDGPLSSVVRLSMTAGNSDSSAGHLLIADKLATQRHWHVGTPVRFTAAGATPVTVRVTGIYRYNQLLGPFLVDGSVYRHLVPRNEWSSMAVLVHAAPGTDLAALRTGLERATDPWYVVTVEDRAGFKGQIAGQINGIIGLLYGLLGLALVIAVLGIVNTLALSVVERRREIGVLRAVGMQRAQVRRTIYLESLLIATFGAVLGVVVGITYGGLFSRALRPAGIDRLSIPITQNAVFLVLAAVVGVLAALWPAARAARTRPLDALTGS